VLNQFLTYFCLPPHRENPKLGDLNKALKDLVTVITDQEIEQSDLNENEIE
jgi:hypothetical protein